MASRKLGSFGQTFLLWRGALCFVYRLVGEERPNEFLLLTSCVPWQFLPLSTHRGRLIGVDSKTPGEGRPGSLDIPSVFSP